MDLQTIAVVVAIMVGISQTISIWKGIISGDNGKNSKVSTNETPSFKSGSPLIKLLLAISVVLFIGGGVTSALIPVLINSEKTSCLEGYDPHYTAIIKPCEEFAKSKYQDELKFGLLSIGASLALSALILFFQNLKTATVIQFVFGILWFGLGVTLIIFSL